MLFSKISNITLIQIIDILIQRRVVFAILRYVLDILLLQHTTNLPLHITFRLNTLFSNEMPYINKTFLIQNIMMNESINSLTQILKIFTRDHQEDPKGIFCYISFEILFLKTIHFLKLRFRGEPFYHKYHLQQT